MNCAVSDCEALVEWACSLHTVPLCHLHWKMHMKDCKSEQISIMHINESIKNQTQKLNKGFFKIRHKIFKMKLRLIESITQAVEKELDSLEKEKASLMRIILRFTPDNEMENFLKLLPKSIKNNREAEIPLEITPPFDLNLFESKIKQLEADFHLKKMKNMCKQRGIKLIEEEFIQKMRLTRDSNYVFICMKYVGN